jgi:Histidine kinase-, DNA gyrase B-, and HSP90-like ATPase
MQLARRSDTGVGIAPEDQEAIFEEFRQVGTADKKVEGTGLGQPLSRKFIELHGGRSGSRAKWTWVRRSNSRFRWGKSAEAVHGTGVAYQAPSHPTWTAVGSC